MSQLVFSIHQNLEEIGSNASEWTDLSVTGSERASRQRDQVSFFLLCPWYRCYQQVWPRLEVWSSHLKRSGLTVGLPTSNGLRKVSYRCIAETWVLVSSRCSHLDNQEHPLPLESIVLPFSLLGSLNAATPSHLLYELCFLCPGHRSEMTVYPY